MPKTKISEFSATAGNNTDIDGINIAEGCPPSGINDAIRELMAQLKDFQAGTAGDSFNGPVGTTTPAAGAFTNLSASGTFALTGDQVQISEGGTGQTTANAAFNALAPSQSTHAGKYLKTDGTNTSWDAIEINTADITGTLPIANGGTGLTALGTGVQTALGQNVTGSGGIVLASSPSLTTPNLGTPSAVTLTNATGLPLSTGVTGTLATTNGGTGLTSFTANGVVYASSTSALTTGSALTFDGTNLALGMSALAARVMTVRGRAAFVAPSTDSQLALYSDGTTNGIYSTYNSSGSYLPMTFYTADVERMRLTSGGDLGIGTSSPGAKLHVSGNQAGTDYNNATIVAGDSTSFGGTVIAIGNNAAGNYSYLQAVKVGHQYNNIVLNPNGGNLGIGTSSPTFLASGSETGVSIKASGVNTAGINVSSSNANNTRMEMFAAYSANQGGFYLKGDSAYPSMVFGQVSGSTYRDSMTLDASGNLLVGTTSSFYATAGRGLVEVNGSSTALIALKTGDTPRGYLAASSSITELAAVGASQPLVFTVNGSERARITSGGYFKASNTGSYLSSTGSYHEFRSNGTALTLQVSNTNASPQGIYVEYSSAAPNGTGNPFLYCADNAALRAEIRSNGGIANYQANDVNLSDQRLKTDVQAAGSYLDKICAIPVKTFLYKDQTDTERNLGVMAQDVDAVAPELIDHSGFGEAPEGESPYLAVYQTDLQYALMKCIQELKAQNDDLRARVAQLEAK